MAVNNYDINDIRQSSQFRGVSFSKFKKTEVRTQFIENMKKGKIEPACYWCAELICAGHFMEVWEIIIHYLGKYINLGNPKLVIYLERRFSIFRNIMLQGHFINELQLRNNPTIRKMFAEIVSVLTLSNKQPGIDPLTIKGEEEFDITQMTEKLKAPSVKYIEPVFLPKDPKEIYIALNEFAYNISKERRNMVSACYWVEWIIEFDALCDKRKTPCHCENRKQYNVENRLRTDIIWIVWDTLFHYCELLPNTAFITSIMNSLLELFCIKYTTAVCRKRRYLLYFAISLLTEPVMVDIDMISDKQIVQNVVEKINNIYKQIKKNEESPNTDYLFSNLDDKQNTFEQSMQRMELMNTMCTL